MLEIHVICTARIPSEIVMNFSVHLPPIAMTIMPSRLAIHVFVTYLLWYLSHYHHGNGSTTGMNDPRVGIMMRYAKVGHGPRDSSKHLTDNKHIVLKTADQIGRIKLV